MKAAKARHVTKIIALFHDFNLLWLNRILDINLGAYAAHFTTSNCYKALQNAYFFPYLAISVLHESNKTDSIAAQTDARSNTNGIFEDTTNIAFQKVNSWRLKELEEPLILGFGYGPT